eukprot:175635-Alexandrium_andersonii.AAC.1
MPRSRRSDAPARSRAPSMWAGLPRADPEDHADRRSEDRGPRPADPRSPRLRSHLIPARSWVGMGSPRKSG